MILYRAMNAKELAAYNDGQTVRPTAEALRSNNSWLSHTVTFFGTANNALHWAVPPVLPTGHVVIAAFEVVDAAVQEGWGIYPDFDAPFSIADMLDGLIYGHCTEHALLKVREYGLPWYSDKQLKMIDGMWIKWSDKYSSRFVNGKAKLDVKNNYDDIIERLVKGNES